MASPCTLRRAGTAEAATDVGQRPPAARHAQAHDVLAGIEELAQGGSAHGRRSIGAHGGDEGAIASEALDRRSPNGPGSLLAVDAPGYADERVGANAGSGHCGWVLVRCLHGGAARRRRAPTARTVSATRGTASTFAPAP